MSECGRFLLGFMGAYMYINVIIALEKKGSITDRKVDSLKVTHRIDKDSVTYTYAQIGPLVTDAKAEVIFTAWKIAIIGFSLRLKMTLLQSTGSCLTPTILVKEAIQKFKDFDWTKMNRMYPGKMTHVIIATDAIGNSQYCGVKLSMCPAASANYHDISNIAKELLAQHGVRTLLQSNNPRVGPRTLNTRRKLIL
jgi:hypothetical protein